MTVITTYSLMQNREQNDISFDRRIYTVKNPEGQKVFEGTHKECMEFMRFGTGGIATAQNRVIH
jgi:hypothetical protein